MTLLEKQCAAAKQAAPKLASAGTELKNKLLSAIAEELSEHSDEWLRANAEDVAAAKANNIKASLIDRLTLTNDRIKGIISAIDELIALPDPIGGEDGAVLRPNGLMIAKRRVPLGVIGIIYEARPNVTVDAAALCLKSGNVCVLRGGKEAIKSNLCAVKLMRNAIKKVGLPEDCISIVQDTSRETANELMHMNDYIDVLIPRGGAGLIRAVSKNASVPVIRTGEGVCHIYVDRDADLDMAANILYNAKCSRPSVCNAAECVIINAECAEEFLKKAIPLLDKNAVELRCDERALKLAGGRGIAADESDWDAEYGDYILAVKIVDCTDEAVEFIALHGTGHSECIVTKNYETARHFLDTVDAAAVYVNASTRFTDGGEFGLGAEIGISTQKMHARGPMGLRELTSYKYIVYGNGQVR